MTRTRAWATYPDTYRAREVRILVAWIEAGVSGAVVGGPGSGKSNLLGFICHRPDVLRPALAADDDVFLIPLDLNNLPAHDLATFYRAILRAFYEARDRLAGDERDEIDALFRAHQGSRDPFVAQSAVRAWLLHLQEREKRVVLVIDRFDWFCEHAPAKMANTLRGLRDSFKDTLSFIVGTRRELVYFAEREAMGELYELLDSFICWLQPMTEHDALLLLAQESAVRTLPPDAARRLLSLSGGYPALLKSACHWWLAQETVPPQRTWVEAMRRFPALSYRLNALWASFTLVEQEALRGLLTRDGGAAGQPPGRQRQQAVERLVARGIVGESEDGLHIRSPLLAAHVQAVAPTTPGGLSWDAETDLMYQGVSPVQTLTPLEGALLRYLLQRPYARHTHTALIEAAWPEDTLREGVSTEALYQVVRGLRRKIEPDPSQPRYIVNWRGVPEGGYRCFPEGKPL